jgi:hypothetical protein
MSQYHHHPDNLIYVRTEKAVYCDTVANFALDFGRIWPLPKDVSEILYEDNPSFDKNSGPRCLRFDRAGNQLAGPRPFPFGDAAIAAIKTLLAAQAKRKADAEEAAKPPPPVPAPPPKGPVPSKGTNKV